MSVCILEQGTWGEGLRQGVEGGLPLRGTVRYPGIQCGSPEMAGLK